MKQAMAIFTLTNILILTSLLHTADARKALGGAGGLHNRGSPRGKSPDVNDPLKLASIGNGWKLPAIDSEELIRKVGKENRNVAQYISDTLGKAPLTVQLGKKTVGVKTSSFATQEKFRAVVTPAQNVKTFKSNLRSMWYIGSERAIMQSGAVQQQEKDLLTKSYEDNSSKLYPSHFVLEVFLPKTRACKGGNPLVTYSIPFGAGTTSPTSKVSQANGIVTVYPNGRKRKGAGEVSEGIEIGRTSFHLNAGTGLVDPAWARGKKFFWKGRDVGTL
eukprot:scaffold7501_cov267-Chaetoceros_neogracile.AAC.5